MRVVRFDAARRAQLAHWLIGAAVIAPVLCLVAAAWAYEETGSWGAVRFFVLYALPLFAAAPLWLRTRVAVIEQLPALVLATDAIVLGLSVARFAASEVLPFSGHMLFLTYTLLTSRECWYRWVAAVLIAETTVFKLLLWRDRASWTIGLACGLAAGAFVLVLESRSRRLLADRDVRAQR